MPNEAQVQAAREASIQSRATSGGRNAHLLMWLSRAGELISPWWSRQRDAELRKFWKTVDHLSGAIYTLESRLSTIPFHIEPIDMTVKSWVRQASAMERMLNEDAEYGEGWNDYFEPFVEDLFSQDNGYFTEVIGEGEPDGPIVGPVLGLAHLDSWRCQRTGDPEFPVIYHDLDGRLSKLHYTRVVFGSSMPSPIHQMYKVGFCAVSRCINVAQTLLDVLVYKQEKLGSRPPRGIITTKGGLDPEDIAAAFVKSEERQDSMMLRRYSKIVVVGDRDIPEGGLELTDLSSLPDGFDEEQSTMLGIASIALAFGVDARELFPATVVGATKADALISHLKQQGKGIGQVLLQVERKFNSKVLPPHLRFVFDFQDDAQDAQVAEIRSTRAGTREKNIGLAITDERTERENMLHDGEITQQQFDDLELNDGRLPDGTPLLTLFHNPEYTKWLDLGVPDPLNTRINDRNTMTDVIQMQIDLVLQDMATETNYKQRRMMNESYEALNELKDEYDSAKKPDPPVPPQPGDQQIGQEDVPAGSDMNDLQPDTTQTMITGDDLDFTPDEDMTHPTASKSDDGKLDQALERIEEIGIYVEAMKASVDGLVNGKAKSNGSNDLS